MKKIFFAFLFAGILGANDELAPHFDECSQGAVGQIGWLACLDIAKNHWQEELEKNYQNSLKLCNLCKNPKLCQEKIKSIKTQWQGHNETLSGLYPNYYLRAYETKQEAMYFKTLADMNICADLGDEK